MTERVAIVGTAPSWRKTPWNDLGLQIASLNDAYRMKGFVRADAWYDIHPMDRFWTPPQDRAVHAHEVPHGAYVRPEKHVEWLSQLQIPLYLQSTPPEGWRHARRFPKEEIESHFGCYFKSTPAWMLAHAILQGAREIHIYGIHLSTEHEYIEQRPNFEFLIGSVLGSGKRRDVVKNGLRYYESPEALIVLPEDTPVMKADYQYAFDPKPGAHLAPLQWELHKVGVKSQRVTKQLLDRKPWTRTKPLKDELLRLGALRTDLTQQMQRLQLQAQMG